MGQDCCGTKPNENEINHDTPQDATITVTPNAPNKEQTVSKEQQDEAATKIQSIYKGQQTRKVLKQEKEDEEDFIKQAQA